MAAQGYPCITPTIFQLRLFFPPSDSIRRTIGDIPNAVGRAIRLGRANTIQFYDYLYSIPRLDDCHNLIPRTGSVHYVGFHHYVDRKYLVSTVLNHRIDESSLVSPDTIRGSLLMISRTGSSSMRTMIVESSTRYPAARVSSLSRAQSESLSYDPWIVGVGVPRIN